MLPKKADEWRYRGGYRSLNEVTVSVSYHIPHISNFTGAVHGARIFSKIDLVKAYRQIPTETVDVPRSAIITAFGLSEYLWMPFGLKTAV